MFELVRCLKNDVRVQSMFDKMVFDPSLQIIAMPTCRTFHSLINLSIFSNKSDIERLVNQIILLGKIIMQGLWYDIYWKMLSCQKNVIIAIGTIQYITFLIQVTNSYERQKYILILQYCSKIEQIDPKNKKHFHQAILRSTQPIFTWLHIFL